MPRRPCVAANWKMHKTGAEAGLPDAESRSGS